MEGGNTAAADPENVKDVAPNFRHITVLAVGSSFPVEGLMLMEPMLFVF